jgi:hypothetical protein
MLLPEAVEFCWGQQKRSSEIISGSYYTYQAPATLLSHGPGRAIRESFFTWRKMPLIQQHEQRPRNKKPGISAGQVASVAKPSFTGRRTNPLFQCWRKATRRWLCQHNPHVEHDSVRPICSGHKTASGGTWYGCSTEIVERI